MPPSRNIATYTDVYQVLEQALKHDKITYELASKGYATNFSLRINTFLKLLRESKTGDRDRYNKLKHRINPANPSQILFSPRGDELSGKLTTPEGALIAAGTPDMESLLNANRPEAPAPTDSSPDDLLEFARAFRKEQGLAPDD